METFSTQSELMKAVTCATSGGPEVLHMTEVSEPVPGDDELLVRVRATALNRADLLQRMGRYPPPAEASAILGLELAGDVEAVGRTAEGFEVGDRVFALVAGGGYAGKAVVDYRMAMGIPPGWTYVQAAAVPEAFLTAQETLFTVGQLTAGEMVLIHAAASGVGTAAVQMARHVGARVLATAGTITKIQTALELGASAACPYKEQDFVPWVLDETDGCGVELVHDPVGAPYWDRHMRCLKEGGRLVVYGVLGGGNIQVNLGALLARRLSIRGTSMRYRPLEDKIAITRRFQEQWLPVLAAGTIRPIIDSVFPLEAVAEAHRRMEANENIGKIVLDV